MVFSTQLDESSITANSCMETIEYILSVYNRTWDNVIAIIGENVSTNKAVASLVGLMLIGCASDRFNLAMVDIIDSYEQVVCIIRTIMVCELLDLFPILTLQHFLK